MGQALDHPHIVKTLMFLVRREDGPMVQFRGDGRVQGSPGSTASGSDAIGEFFLQQVRSADRVGGGRGRRPAGQALSLPTASLATSSFGSASGRSRLSLPSGPAGGQGSTGLGWMEGSMTAGAAARWRAEIAGHPRGEGTAGRGQAAGPRSATSAESGTGYRRLTLCSSSDHWSSSSARLSAGLQRGNVSSAGSGGDGDGGGGGGGVVDALHAPSHASSNASLPAGMGILGMGRLSTNRSGSDAPVGGTVAAGAGFLPAGRGGNQLEAVPESASPSNSDTSLTGSHGAQQQSADDVSAAGSTAGQEALIASPFSSEQHFESMGEGTSSAATHHTHAQDTCTFLSSAMLTGLQQQQLETTTGVSDAALAESGAHVPLTTASRQGVGRLGGGGSAVQSTGDSSTVGGSGGAGGSLGQLSMTSSQVAAAVRLTSASGVWRQRQGSAAISGAAALSHGVLLGSGSSTWQSGAGSGAGAATPGSDDAGTASRSGGRRGMAGAIGKVAPGRPKQQQQERQQERQGPAPVSSGQVLPLRPKGSGCSSLASSGSHPSAALLSPRPQQLFSQSTTPRVLGPPVDRVARARAPAGAPGPVAEDPAADQGPEAAAAREARRQTLMLLTTGASSSSSSTAAGTPPTTSSRALSSATSPKPPPSSSGSAPQARQRSHLQQPQSQPPRSPPPRQQLQRAVTMAQVATGASRAPESAASLSAFAVASQRRVSSGPFTGPGVAPTGDAAAGTGPNQAGPLATSPSAPTASTDAAPVGFPSTAAEASAVRHGGTADEVPHSHSHPAGRGSSVPWEVLRQECYPAERQEGPEEEELPAGVGGGSFSDIDSGSELMGANILDSPRTAARVAREVGSRLCSKHCATPELPVLLLKLG